MADHIQIGDITPRIQYTGDGSQTDFDYPFPIFADADLEVYADATLETLTTDYTVSGAGVSTGGTVAFLTAPANGVVVTLRRRLAVARTSDFQESGEFRANVINDELDKQTAFIQQVEDDLERVLVLDPTDPDATLTLPVKADRSGKFLAFDADGDVMASAGGASVAVSAVMEPVIQAASLAAARTALGLGSAAVKDTGTNEGDVVEVQAGGALPALDGSALIGIAAGATDAERANILLNAFRIQVVGGLSVLDMIDGVVDEFEDETGVDTGASSGAVYDATNDCYGNPALSAISQATGTLSGNFTAGGGNSTIFDGNTSQAYTAGGLTSGQPAYGYVVKDWGAGITKTIGKYKIYGPNDNEVCPEAGTGASVTIKLQGSTDNFSSSIVDLHSDTFNAAASGEVKEYTSGIDTSTAYRYHRVVVDPATTSNSALCEVELWEATGASDITLISQTTAAAAQPAEAHLVVWEEDVDSVTLNTDLLAYATRDGGTTWTLGVLTEEGSLGTGRILTATIDISGQPAGTTMAWKLVTANSKELKIHGVGLEWR